MDYLNGFGADEDRGGGSKFWPVVVIGGLGLLAWIALRPRVETVTKQVQTDPNAQAGGSTPPLDVSAREVAASNVTRDM
jgi:hypothetical protein